MYNILHVLLRLQTIYYLLIVYINSYYEIEN